MKATVQQIQPVLAARDVAESIAFYQQLGFTLIFQDDKTAPRYAALQRDGAELHLQWADATQWQHGGDRPVIRLMVDDVDALYEEFVAASVRLATEHESPWYRPANTPWGTREFHLRDPGGNGLQFYRVG